jgi:hypothetical protein
MKIHLLHVSTSLGHLQVGFFFQGIYRTVHIKCELVSEKLLHYRRKVTTNNDDSVRQDAEV